MNQTLHFSLQMQRAQWYSLNGESHYELPRDIEHWSLL